MQTQTVKHGYNAVIRSYLAERSMLKSAKYVQKLLKHLKPHSSILDLGCGAGVPVDDLLLKAGHSVVGIDISEEMIQTAKKSCPAGEYIVGDITRLQQGNYAVDAVVSFYTFFHIPRGEHARTLKTINSFLPKGGVLLITMGDKDYEGTTDLYGTPMWYSQWGPAKNRELVRNAGFEIVLDEIDHSGAEHHQIIMAVKN